MLTKKQLTEYKICQMLLEKCEVKLNRNSNKFYIENLTIPDVFSKEKITFSFCMDIHGMVLEINDKDPRVYASNELNLILRALDRVDILKVNEEEIYCVKYGR